MCKISDRHYRLRLTHKEFLALGQNFRENDYGMKLNATPLNQLNAEEIPGFDALEALARHLGRQAARSEEITSFKVNLDLEISLKFYKP